MIPPLHRWVSVRALRSFGFSRRAIRIVSETSQWTDWYRWTDSVANAATPIDATGQPRDPRASATACSALLREYLKRLEAAPLNEQLVWLGFALHLAEDLASHQGRTDTEHTLQVFLIVPNPDWSPSAVRRGFQYARRVLAAVRDQFGPRWPALQAAAGARLLTAAEAEHLLGEKDITWPSFWQTMLAFRHYLRTPPSLRRIRWDTDAVLQAGFAADGAPESSRAS